MDAQAAAAQFPPGYLENYNGHKLVVTCIACIILNIFFVFARFFSRWLHHTPRGWDDFLMVPALIFSVLLAAQGLVGINYCGVGHHIEAIELSAPSKLLALYKLLMFFPATYAIAVTFPKLSILAMYLRIFTVPFYRMITYFVIYILVISSTILFMMMLFQCTPVDYFWDKTIVGGKCHFDIEKLFLYASLPNIITDIVMLLLPLPFIFRLNMTRKVKIGLGVTLLTGSSGLATSILRFVSFANQSLFPDTPRAAVDLALYTILETSMYIIAACLPACRPLFNIILHPSRNMPQDQKDGLNSPEEHARTLHDDIELQQTSETSSGSENGNGSTGGRYHGIGDGFRGMQGRFKRLGSDAGLFLGRRDVSPPPPSTQSYPHSQSSSAPSHSLQPQERDPDRQFSEQAEGRFGLGLSKFRSSSHERIFKAPVFKQPFRAPERVHIANMHVGHMQMSPEEDKERQGGQMRDGIRVKQEFDVYYDRPPL
ncbi:uncharacterized protein EAE97_002448 [Botrytis byssoidea]|uniref:Rhodopsin domain-containing protein n=1 Tax=Botrytis byssoidea TaxID=139641 RepID=A0A9P5ITJ3_9HELO|nr:uncharacterized protein EAE97_002448 [Botrytis byssoidea]KAF7950896.1 hypothetical protein EAE97_002448 [Botrytis byssoidea]